MQQQREKTTEEYPQLNSRLHFQVSKVASLVGLANAEGNIFEILIEYVYQFQPKLLEEDENVIGFKLQKASSKAKQYLSTRSQLCRNLFRNATENGIRAASSLSVSHATRAVHNLTTQLAKGGSISQQGARLIRKDLSSSILKNFGTKRETAAIRLYESRFQRRVTHRNESIFIWPWARPKDTKYRNEYQWQAYCSLLPFPSVRTFGASSFNDFEYLRSFFSLSGKIDGITKSHDSMEELIVEVKCRAWRQAVISQPPNRDVIQLSLYLHMLSKCTGDLVQCHLGRSPETSLVSSHRVDLDEDQAFHRSGFRTIVLPRLFMLAQTVHRIRRDQLTRLRLLRAHKESLLVNSTNEFSEFSKEVYAEIVADCPYMKASI